MILPSPRTTIFFFIKNNKQLYSIHWINPLSFVFFLLLAERPKKKILLIVAGKKSNSSAWLLLLVSCYNTHMWSPGDTNPVSYGVVRTIRCSTTSQFVSSTLFLCWLRAVSCTLITDFWPGILLIQTKTSIQKTNWKKKSILMALLDGPRIFVNSRN